MSTWVGYKQDSAISVPKLCPEHSEASLLVTKSTPISVPDILLTAVHGPTISFKSHYTLRVYPHVGPIHMMWKTKLRPGEAE